jgi:hypothetical protein
VSLKISCDKALTANWWRCIDALFTALGVESAPNPGTQKAESYLHDKTHESFIVAC